MGCLPRIGAGLLLAVLPAFAATAQSWESAIAADGDRAGGLIAVDGQTLTLGCARKNGAILSVLLDGGPRQDMAEMDDTLGSATMTITHGNGAIHSYLIEGFYIADEGTFVGQHATTEDSLRVFAQGNRLVLTRPSGEEIFAAPMTGTSKFRGAIAEACGI